MIIVSMVEDSKITFNIDGTVYDYSLPPGVRSSTLILESDDPAALLAKVLSIGEIIDKDALVWHPHGAWPLCRNGGSYPA